MRQRRGERLQRLGVAPDPVKASRCAFHEAFEFHARVKDSIEKAPKRFNRWIPVGAGGVMC